MGSAGIVWRNMTSGSFEFTPLLHMRLVRSISIIKSFYQIKGRGTVLLFFVLLLWFYEVTCVQYITAANPWGINVIAESADSVLLFVKT